MLFCISPAGKRRIVIFITRPRCEPLAGSCIVEENKFKGNDYSMNERDSESEMSDESGSESE